MIDALSHSLRVARSVLSHREAAPRRKSGWSTLTTRPQTGMRTPRAQASQLKPGASDAKRVHGVGLSDRSGSRLDTESR